MLNNQVYMVFHVHGFRLYTCGSRETFRRTWDEQIKVDLHELNLSEDLTRNRGKWRRLIHVLDYWFSLRLLVGVLVLWLLFVAITIIIIVFFFTFNCFFTLFYYIHMHCIYIILCLKVTLVCDKMQTCGVRFSRTRSHQLQNLILFFLESGDSSVALSFIGMSCLRPSLLRP